MKNADKSEVWENCEFAPRQIIFYGGTETKIASVDPGLVPRGRVPIESRRSEAGFICVPVSDISAKQAT